MTRAIGAAQGGAAGGAPGHREPAARFAPPLLPRSLLFPRTLRGRLIAGLVTLLAIGCASVGIVSYFAIEGALSRELNGELQTATGLAYNCWENQVSESGSAGPAATPLPTALGNCPGLGERTFVAVSWHGQWEAALIGDTSFRLTAADEKTLLAVAAYQPPAGRWSPSQQVPSTDCYLNLAEGRFQLTAIRDPDGDGSVYITGLPLSALHDTLADVALAEALVSAAVLVLAGVTGTLWVRFSLHPLRRVAVTAAHVAELNLDSGEVSLPAGVPDTDPRTETGQVGLAFNRMLGHMQTALRRRAASEARLRRFAADASHELRTPLAAIRGYAELGLRHPGDSPEPVTHALGRVLSESTRMSVLVEDLLLLARLDAGRPLESVPVDVTRLAIDVTSDAQVARASHRWILELPDDPVLVRGDEHRLHQVLGNLLSNAGKHTPAGTTVTVAVSGRLPDGEPGSGPQSVARGAVPAGPLVVITVTDDGPGIPAALLPDLFERFTRADTARSHADSAASAGATSTGLGLAIVDAVVAALGGAVLVTSRAGMTRAAIVLPALAGDAAPVGPTARASARDLWRAFSGRVLTCLLVAISDFQWALHVQPHVPSARRIGNCRVS